MPTDVSSPGDCQALADAAMAEFGRIDILVNNAGVSSAAPATRETPEAFARVIGINLNGCYWMAQACGRVMQPGSTIVNIASVLALTTAGLPQAAYTASKAGLLGLTRDLAQQWAGRKGIRVNALAPGFFPSEMTEEYRPGYLEAQLQRVPMGRDGRPRRAHRGPDLPGQRRQQLRQRADPGGRRRADDHLTRRPARAQPPLGEARQRSLMAQGGIWRRTAVGARTCPWLCG